MNTLHRKQLRSERIQIRSEGVVFRIAKKNRYALLDELIFYERGNPGTYPRRVRTATLSNHRPILERYAEGSC